MREKRTRRRACPFFAQASHGKKGREKKAEQSPLKRGTSSESRKTQGNKEKGNGAPSGRGETFLPLSFRKLEVQRGKIERRNRREARLEKVISLSAVTLTQKQSSHRRKRNEHETADSKRGACQGPSSRGGVRPHSVQRDLGKHKKRLDQSKTERKRGLNTFKK